MNLLDDPLASPEATKNSVKRESIDLGKPDELLVFNQWGNVTEFTNPESRSSYSDLSIEEKMAFNKKRRRQIFEETQELRKCINPLEFEAYEDYFVLKKFRKGVSASGRVGIGENRTRSTGVYYEKITRNGDNGSNEDDSSQESETGSKEKRRSKRVQSSVVKKELSESDIFLNSSPAPQSAKSNTGVFDTSTSASSIIPSNNTDVNVRRSSRLSSKEREILEKKASRLQEAGFEDANPKILDLFESIIPKIISPVRRSDWLLPNKNQFIPEKFVPIKHTPEQIKINDLIHNSKIRRIMKRFKGGLAGVRKKDWDYVNEPNQTDKN
ncbi:LAFA_0B04258g1_1 [Lachancea sp. 'fantastica']|nr:LAFA_0B04258g1_1 [Lachancea sp. 'fantastica']